MVAILVVLTFVTFIVISSLLQRKQIAHEFDRSPFMRRTGYLSFPLGYFFSPNHLWASLESSGILKMGADDLLHRFLGKLDGIHLKKPGEYVHKGEMLLSFTKGGREVFVASPVSGVIEYTNSEAEKNPGEFAGDPYETGWLYLLRPSKLAAELKSFKLAEAAKSWMSHEIARSKDFAKINIPQPIMAGLTLPDGGLLIEGIVDHLDAKGLREFERQFLLNLEEAE